MRFTPAQTRYFLAAIDDHERDAQRLAIAAARAATADKRDRETYLKALEALG